MISSRILAGATIVGGLYLGFVSWVFGTFSVSPIPGQNCTYPAYGYDYGYGYWYGYDCTPIPPPSTSGWWPGGGSPGNPPPPNRIGDEIIPPAGIEPFSEKLFPEFVPDCSGEATSLTDARVLSYYDVLEVLNRANIDRRLTRIEFLKLLLNAAGVDVQSAGTATPFSDVASNTWYAPYVAYAVKGGIVHGDEGKFRPNDILSRAEASKILIRGTSLWYSTGSIVFSDVLPSNTLGIYIQTAFDNCILHGRHTVNGIPTTPTRLFEPSDGISLWETVKILYNMTR